MFVSKPQKLLPVIWNGILLSKAETVETLRSGKDGGERIFSDVFILYEIKTIYSYTKREEEGKTWTRKLIL